MTRHPYRLWIIVLLLGWSFDYLFWKQNPGLNFAGFLGLCLLAGTLLLLSFHLKPAPNHLLLLLPCAFFAATSFLRQEPLTRGLAYALSLACAGLYSVTYLSGRWPAFNLFDYLAVLFGLAGSLIARPWLYAGRVQRELAGQGKRLLPSGTGAVLRGVALAIPIIVIFSALLASADLVFNQQLINFFDFLRPENLPEIILRVLLALGCAYLLAGVFLHAGEVSGGAPSERPGLPRFLGFTEAAVVQGSVTALFLLFVLVQFRYFFGGEVNIGVQGYTYSQYARSGFNELVTVALLSLLLTLGLSSITRRTDERQRRIFSGLSVAILVLVLVILVSAYQRLALAMDWHGYSRLRLYPRVFMVWVGLLFVLVVALEIGQRERFFALAALLAVLGFAATLSLLNVDASIVHHNVWRALNGRHFNDSHLTALSNDAIPALVEEFRRGDLPAEIHERIGGALLCYASTGRVDQKDPDWRSLSLARQSARRSFASVQGALEHYQVNQEPGVVRVGTPGNHWVECALNVKE